MFVVIVVCDEVSEARARYFAVMRLVKVTLSSSGESMDIESSLLRVGGFGASWAPGHCSDSSLEIWHEI